jgi:hypothetical protein
MFMTRSERWKALSRRRFLRMLGWAGASGVLARAAPRPYAFVAYPHVIDGLGT